MTLSNRLKGGIFGVAIGDALGVPVEFTSRDMLRRQPVTDYMGYMCWNQPPGTWSDDTSLTLCLIDSLIHGYDIENIGLTFARWYNEGYWGAHHKVFDIGGSTKLSLNRILRGESALYSGNMFEQDNGNGSLMRTLPLVFLLSDETSILERYAKIKEVSSVTHAHFRSVFSCFIYVELAILLLHGLDKNTAYENMKVSVLDFSKKMDFNPDEIRLFQRILIKDIQKEKEDDIKSSGYVLHSLEAALWCFLKSDSYLETVLKAVNLGEDTDTTGAIAGGVAGLYYGMEKIPQKWEHGLVRSEDIEELLRLFIKSL